jgi:hypothetical protein
MPLTLEEITQCEEGLRQEIAERERLLAAYQLIRADRANPVSAASNLVLAPPATVHRLEDGAESSPAPVNQPAPLAPKINPALAALGSGFGRNGKAVSWAIQQMTEDYTLNDIAALLQREGFQMRGAEISVVLTRMKRRGQIEEISGGRGRKAAVFRKPEIVTPQERKIIAPTGDSESITETTTGE